MAAWRSQQATKHSQTKLTGGCMTMGSRKEGHDLANEMARLCSSRDEVAPLAGTSSSGEESCNRNVEFRDQLFGQGFATGKNSFEHQTVCAAVIDLHVVIAWVHHP